MRWQSRDLTSFCRLFDQVAEFLVNKDTELKDILIKLKIAIAYLTDLYKLCGCVTLQLECNALNLIKTKSIITAFVTKLVLYKANINIYELNSLSKFLSSIHQYTTMICLSIAFAEFPR